MEDNATILSVPLVRGSLTWIFNRHPKPPKSKHHTLSPNPSDTPRKPHNGTSRNTTTTFPNPVPISQNNVRYSSHATAGCPPTPNFLVTVGRVRGRASVPRCLDRVVHLSQAFMITDPRSRFVPTSLDTCTC
ncbi:hypothetical protein BDV96DRAFT_83047 [Lophiotrema nucula]|uniref:Uncharacterized protein n=1 Tax=Lophiotrema nucula TaxID=690887 RepID=A0A6A5Z829_9PLEO|nr:hypothetical protein BDV96DRAFT_83047 [Lophiotrema nucula]